MMVCEPVWIWIRFSCWISLNYICIIFYSSGEKTIVAMGLLNTMETVLVVMDEQPEISIKLEPILLQVVSLILEATIMEFYEEAFSMVSSLTEKQISPQMWQVFEAIYRSVDLINSRTILLNHTKLCSIT